MPDTQQQYRVDILIKATGEDDKKYSYLIYAPDNKDAGRQAADLAATCLKDRLFEYNQCNVNVLLLEDRSQAQKILDANKPGSRVSLNYPSLD